MGAVIIIILMHLLVSTHYIYNVYNLLIDTFVKVDGACVFLHALLKLFWDDVFEAVLTCLPWLGGCSLKHANEMLHKWALAEGGVCVAGRKLALIFKVISCASNLYVSFFCPLSSHSWTEPALVVRQCTAALFILHI